MATKKQTVSDQLQDFSIHLNSLNQIIKLCAFATEARRTLNDIDQYKSISPDFDKAIFKHIDACNEWSTHSDDVGSVLRDVSYQIDKLSDQLALGGV